MKDVTAGKVLVISHTRGRFAPIQPKTLAGNRE